MPQVTCPKCGTTINLKNRKEIDFNLIVVATKSKPRTFTELLHLTRLSRKTLSLRLKELCDNGTIVKNDGVYGITSGSGQKFERKFALKELSTMASDKRIRMGLMMVAFLLTSSGFGYVMAKFILSPPPTQESLKPIGEFTMALNVENIEDLYAWQAVVTYDPDVLSALRSTPCGFFDYEYPFFFNATDIANGLLLIGGTLYGDVSGKSGAGTLATIEFGYLTQEYEMPELALSGMGFKTYLLNSKGVIIPLEKSTVLTLGTIENP